MGLLNNVIDEEAIAKHIIQPLVDRLEQETIPQLGTTLEGVIRGALDGATVTITLNLKK